MLVTMIAPVASAQDSSRAELSRVGAYLGRAGLLPFVDGDLVPHGSGSSFHVTFRFAADDQSKARILAILRNTRVFDAGPLGPGHVKDVGASVRSDAWDFRSHNGALGRRSLEVMINRKSFWGYADVDRFDLYGGAAPAFAHVFFELLPHKTIGWFRNPPGWRGLERALKKGWRARPALTWRPPFRRDASPSR
jgi:hypothetical protein